MHPTIVMLAKAPRQGFVKTRLAAQVGVDRATWLYRLLVERQLRALPAGWRVEVHFTPLEAEAEMRSWLGEHRLFVPQVIGDLGARLQSALAHGFDARTPAVIAIGGDCPELGAEDLLRAEQALRRKDVVIGPARDGGYYLIGLRAPAPPLFIDMPWSTPDLLAKTVERAEEFGLSLELLDVKDDIDDTASMWRVAARLSAAGSPDRNFGDGMAEDFA